MVTETAGSGGGSCLIGGLGKDHLTAVKNGNDSLHIDPGMAFAQQGRHGAPLLRPKSEAGTNVNGCDPACPGGALNVNGLDVPRTDRQRATASGK